MSFKYQACFYSLLYAKFETFTDSISSKVNLWSNCISFQILRHISYKMKGKTSSRMVRFLNQYLPNEFTSPRSFYSFVRKILPKKCSKLAAECDWKDKVSQIVPKTGFWKKPRLVFQKKLTFFKSFQGSKFAVECNWKSRISQKVQGLGFF